MSSPSKELRTLKRLSPDDNTKTRTYSPSKLLSPLNVVKNVKRLIMGSPYKDEEDESVGSNKKARIDNTNNNINGFITSSPNTAKKAAKGLPTTPSDPQSPCQRKLQRNLSTEFASVDKDSEKGKMDVYQEEENCSQSPEPKSPGKKSLLDSLFSPFRWHFANSSRSPSEKNSPAKGKNELAADETLSEEISKEDSPPGETHDALYDPYNSVEEEDVEEEEEFDPYLFIANLPPLYTLSPLPRTKLPPKKSGDPKVTLVLDLDETLVHCSTEPLENAEMTFPVTYGGKEYQVYVRKRPYFENFLRRVSSMFEVVVFTASQEVYARKLLDLIDPHGRYIHHRLYRDACVCVEGNYLKDLTVLGRDLSQVVIVDNSPQAFGFQLENGIPIESWFDDKQDRELETLLPFLEGLLQVSDVRLRVKDTFRLCDRVQKLKHDLRL